MQMFLFDGHGSTLPGEPIILHPGQFIIMKNGCTKRSGAQGIQDNLWGKDNKTVTKENPYDFVKSILDLDRNTSINVYYGNMKDPSKCPPLLLKAIIDSEDGTRFIPRSGLFNIPVKWNDIIETDKPTPIEQMYSKMPYEARPKYIDQDTRQINLIKTSYLYLDGRDKSIPKVVSFPIYSIQYEKNKNIIDFLKKDDTYGYDKFHLSQIVKMMGTTPFILHCNTCTVKEYPERGNYFQETAGGQGKNLVCLLDELDSRRFHDQFPDIDIRKICNHPGASGYSDPRGASGYSDPRGASGYSDPRGASGYSDPRGASGYSDPRYYGHPDPRYNRDPYAQKYLEYKYKYLELKKSIK